MSKRTSHGRKGKQASDFHVKTTLTRRHYYLTLIFLCTSCSNKKNVPTEKTFFSVKFTTNAIENHVNTQFHSYFFQKLLKLAEKQVINYTQKPPVSNTLVQKKFTCFLEVHPLPFVFSLALLLGLLCCMCHKNKL